MEDVGLAQRCADLRRRLHETEQNNEQMLLTIERTRVLVQRARLERAVLLEKLEATSRAGRAPDVEDTPPPSPLLSSTGGAKRQASATPENGSEVSAKRSRTESRPKRENDGTSVTATTQKNGKRKAAKLPSVVATAALPESERDDAQELARTRRLDYARELAASSTDSPLKQRAKEALKQIQDQGLSGPSIDLALRGFSEEDDGYDRSDEDDEDDEQEDGVGADEDEDEEAEDLRAESYPPSEPASEPASELPSEPSELPSEQVDLTSDPASAIASELPDVQQ